MTGLAARRRWNEETLPVWVRWISAFHFKKGQRIALSGCYGQKSLKLVRSSEYSQHFCKIVGQCAPESLIAASLPGS